MTDIFLNFHSNYIEINITIILYKSERNGDILLKINSGWMRIGV